VPPPCHPQRTDGKKEAFIKRGLLVSVAIASEDEGAQEEMVRWAVRKVLNARLYDSQTTGVPWSQSVIEAGLTILIVPQVKA
tara:strand:+ start:598 stop:843 length:246 start_codon:yes stop_codon:yes gene_type:complete